MKKFIFAAVLVFGFVLSTGVAFADEEVATSTRAIGGHRHAYVAGFVDSINNRGAWLLENIPSFRLSYVAENPVTDEEVRVKSLWSQVIQWFQ